MLERAVFRRCRICLAGTIEREGGVYKTEAKAFQVILFQFSCYPTPAQPFSHVSSHIRAGKGVMAFF
jgi:hypothetical protein